MTEPTAPARPARVPYGDLDAHAGALMEIAAWPALPGTLRAVYLALTLRPDLDQALLAEVVGNTRPTVARHERYLAALGLLDPETRTVLYRKTGSCAPRV